MNDILNLSGLTSNLYKYINIGISNRNIKIYNTK